MGSIGTALGTHFAEINAQLEKTFPSIILKIVKDLDALEAGKELLIFEGRTSRPLSDKDIDTDCRSAPREDVKVLLFAQKLRQAKLPVHLSSSSQPAKPSHNATLGDFHEGVSTHTTRVFLRK